MLAASVAVGLLLPVFGVSPIQGLYYSAILNGLIAPPLIALMLIVSRSDALDERHRSRWLSTGLVGATLLISVGLPLAVAASR